MKFAETAFWLALRAKEKNHRYSNPFFALNICQIPFDGIALKASVAKKRADMFA